MKFNVKSLIIKLRLHTSQIFENKKYLRGIQYCKDDKYKRSVYIYANQAQRSIKYCYPATMFIKLWLKSSKRCSCHCVRDAFEMFIVECHAIPLGWFGNKVMDLSG